MTYKEREYQAHLDHLVCEEWRHGARDVMPVLPCGGGKTVIFSNMIAREQGASVAIAHRNHLVTQMSLTLARNGVRHRVIGSDVAVSACVATQMRILGRHFVDSRAPAAVAGVDTLVRMDPRDPWFAQVTLVITDEGHHVLRENKWGKCRAMFPNARGASFTATARRPDGKGLGRATDGLMDSLVDIIGMRELIEMGYLTDYRVYAPDNSLDLSKVSITDSGEFSQTQVREAVHKASITGDVVNTYLSKARGKLGATFAVDVEEARKLTEAYRAAGVPAELITAETPGPTRMRIFERYERREVLQLVSVDILGEGTDVPAMECVSLARPTSSWVTYVQQFCRPLRIADGKDCGIIFDHVRNVERFSKLYGLPDTPQRYNLERRERGARSVSPDAVPVRTCLGIVDEGLSTEHPCCATYERALLACPECGHEPAPAGRSTPAQVDGDLALLDVGALRALWGEKARVDGPVYVPQGVPARPVANNHHARQLAQASLRRAIELYGGWQTHLGRDIREAQKRFFFAFGLDPVTAQTLGARDALELETKIRAMLESKRIIDASVNMGQANANT